MIYKMELKNVFDYKIVLYAGCMNSTFIPTMSHNFHDLLLYKMIYRYRRSWLLYHF